MLTTALNQKTSSRLLILGLIGLLGILVTGCGTSKYSFNSSSVVPGAEGTVKVKRDDNRNYKINLQTRRLADSRDLTPPRDLYMVWMETESGEVRQLGQLKSSSGLFSKRLKGSLNTVSVVRPTQVFITAENSASRYPTGTKVLETRRF